AGLDEVAGGLLAAGQHAVADEAGADAGEGRDLADLLGQIHRRGDDFIRRVFGADDFEQLHHVGRREEVQAYDVLRTLGDRGDLVDVEVGGVGGEDGAGLRDLVEV